jgi:hypothetical protein
MQFFVEIIDKKLDEGDGVLMMCTPACVIIIYVIFLEIIDNEKIRGK